MEIFILDSVQEDQIEVSFKIYSVSMEGVRVDSCGRNLNEVQAFTCCLCLAGGVICASVPLKCLDVSHRIPWKIKCAVNCL